jgi:hypothetical protein
MIAAVVRRSSFRGVVDHCFFCAKKKDEDAMLCGKQMRAFFVVMFQVLYLASPASRIASDKRKLMNDVNTALSSSSITLTTSPRPRTRAMIHKLAEVPSAKRKTSRDNDRQEVFRQPTCSWGERLN